MADSDSGATVDSCDHSSRPDPRSGEALVINNLLAGGAHRSTGSTLYTAALTGGAQALARSSGAIAEGQRADLVALDTGHPALAGRRNEQLVDAWLFAGNDSPVSDVFVGGRRVVEGGRHADDDAVGQRYQATVQRLLEDL